MRLPRSAAGTISLFRGFFVLAQPSLPLYRKHGDSYRFPSPPIARSCDDENLRGDNLAYVSCAKSAKISTLRNNVVCRYISTFTVRRCVRRSLVSAIIALTREFSLSGIYPSSVRVIVAQRSVVFYKDIMEIELRQRKDNFE